MKRNGRPAQGDNLLRKKRERSGATGPAANTRTTPRNRSHPSSAPSQPAAQSLRYSATELANKREVEKCLYALFEEACLAEAAHTPATKIRSKGKSTPTTTTPPTNTPPTLSYDSYSQLLSKLRVLEGLENTEEVLRKTRPPPGCRVGWNDFNICLKIVALNKYPDEEMEDAVDRVVVDIVGEWLQRSMLPQELPPSYPDVPDYVNGLGDTSVVPVPEGVQPLPHALPAVQVEKKEKVKKIEEDERPWIPEELVLVLQEMVGVRGERAWCVDHFVGFLQGLLGGWLDKVVVTVLSDAWERQCAAYPQIHLGAFCEAFSDVSECIFPYASREVAQQLTLQVALTALDTPFGFAEPL